MREITTYDFFGPASLTDAELDWFHAVVAKCKAATGCTVEIIAYNHDLYDGKSRDALGCCITDNTEDPLQGDTWITIDTWFIHEKYEEEFCNGFSIERQSLVDVIAHEIAHTYQWRHCKRHQRITSELVEKIQAAA
ncbi:MAG: hypothetical protein IIZ29_05430 [Schwartzia sp.]|nr:hypothetical protein [Schwartzia sp. (in: firmicutes)]